jgi:hypothetical protein
MKTPPQLFDGSGIEQLAKSLEGLYDAADGDAEVVNGFGILGMFRGVPQVLGKALQTEFRFRYRVLRNRIELHQFTRVIVSRAP